MSPSITFAPTGDPLVSVIITSWRAGPRLLACLRSLHAGVSDRVPYEVLVSLNESSADLRDQIAAEVNGARIEAFAANLGFGGAVNQAASHARGRYLALLNDDCILESAWLEPLVDLLEGRAQCGIVGGRLLHPDGSLQEAGSVIWPDGSTAAVGDGAASDSAFFARRVDYCSAASMLIRHDVWKALGGFDDAFYPAYYEDVDLCLRATAAGWQVWYQPLSDATHFRSSSTGSAFRQFLMQTNAATFRARWGHELTERTGPRELEAAIWQGMGRPIRVLVLDDRLPDPSFGAGHGRMWEVVRMLARDGLHVAVHPREPSVGNRSTLAGWGVRVVDDLAAHLATPGVDYDVVLVSRPHNGRIFAELLHGRLGAARIIYDAESLFYRRIQQQAELAATPQSRAALVRAASAMAAEEQGLVGRVDRIVCVSAAEAEIVRGWTAAPVDVVELWQGDVVASPAGFAQRADIGFVAGWSAGWESPNADGLAWFVAEVLPKVAARVPGVRVLVTGASPPVELLRLAGPSVRFLGALPDLEDFYNSIRVAIAPIRYGAGVKLKTVDAIQRAVPIVTTTEGAAGISWARSMWVADEASAFAIAVADLLTSPDGWHRVRQAQLDLKISDRIENRGVAIWPHIVRATAATTERPCATGGRAGRSLE
jgi:GT2 family glycosyltransferase